MDWFSLLLLVAKVALAVLADELDPANRKRAPGEAAPQAKQEKEAPKEAPRPPPQAEPRTPYAAPQSPESAGWGVRSEPQPAPVIRIETDDGTTVSPLSVLGDRAYVAPRAQRERKPGESRRARRSARTEEASREPAAPRPSRMDAYIEEVRARSRAVLAREAEEARLAAEAKAAAIRPARRRRVGEPPGLVQLAPATLLLLTAGEPLTGAAGAA